MCRSEDAVGTRSQRREGDCRCLQEQGHPCCSYAAGWLFSTRWEPFGRATPNREQDFTCPCAERLLEATAGLAMGHSPLILHLCSLGLLLVTLPNKWGLGCKGALVQQPGSPGLARTSRAARMDWQPSTTGRLGQRAIGHRSHHPYPSLSFGHLPHQPQRLWQTLQSTGKGHSAGVSSHRSPVTDEPCSAWQALYHHGFIAPYCTAPPGPAHPLLPSHLSPISLSAGILNP